MEISKKLHHILKAQTDLTEAELDDISEREGWSIVYANTPKKDTRFQICFTGFSPSERNGLIKLANGNGFKVVKSATVKLNYLCCGDNAGPSKLEKAKKIGALVLSKVEFESLINTGIEP